MSDTSISYIFTFDTKTQEFKLTSKQDIHVIDANHKKYNWLQNLEAGRIVKISAKGKWTSSKDYNNLYETIKPPQKVVLKKAKKKKEQVAPDQKESKKTSSDQSLPNNELMESSNYGFFFNEKAGYYLLRDAEGKEVHIEAPHPKFDWIAQQEAGRVIKINEKGRWNSSKDYKGLYERIGDVSFDKKKSTKKTKKDLRQGIDQDPKISHLNKKEVKQDNNKHNKETEALRKEITRLEAELKREKKNRLYYEEKWSSSLDEMLNAPNDIYILDGLQATSEDNYAYLKTKAEELGVTINIRINPWKDGTDELCFWGFKSKVMKLAEITGHAKDVGASKAYALVHVTIDTLKTIESKLRKQNRENVLLKKDIEKASKTRVVKKANKPPKVVEKQQWEAKIVADLSYVRKYSSDKSKCKESITITIVTDFLEKAPSQSVFKSFLKQKLQNPLSYPSSIDHRISRISGLSDGLLQSNRKLTNILFSYIQKYY